MNTLRLIIFLILIAIINGCSTSANNDFTEVSIKTTVGEIKVRLYNETPLHRNNFILLASSGFYNGIPFHRVMNGFMIQAGDGTLRKAASRPDDTINTYTIPSEFDSRLFHKKGALAAARYENDVNPSMRSSGTQFYLVQGKRYNDDELTAVEQVTRNQIKQALFIRFISQVSDSSMKNNLNLTEAEIQETASLQLFDYLEQSGEYKMSDEQKSVYKNAGGVPFLDGTYTVFGEVTEGLEIIDKIASAKTDASDRPLSDIYIIKMNVLKH